MTKISIIIPSYNHARFIRQCIDSALVQTYTDAEIVVVDDGSTDETVSILEGYGSRITYVVQENQGTQAARNTAIELSNGEYIALLDSDDVWLSHKLARQAPLLDQNPKVGLVYAQALRIDEQGQTLNRGRSFGRPPNGERAFEDLLMGDFVPTLTAVVRRSHLDRPRPFDESLLGAGDWDLWLRMAARHEIVCVEEPLALYRVHGGNTAPQLQARGAALIEALAVLDNVFSSVVPHKPSAAGLRPMATACAYLRAGTWSCQSGQPEQALRWLAEAVEMCPDVAHEGQRLARPLRAWAKSVASQPEHWSKAVGYLDARFSHLLTVAPNAERELARIQAEALLGLAFAHRQLGSREQVRQTLWRALEFDLAQLRNPGVRSLVVESVLGVRLADTLRRARRQWGASTTLQGD